MTIVEYRKVSCPNPMCKGMVIIGDQICLNCMHRLTLCPQCSNVMDATIGICSKCGYGLEPGMSASITTGTGKADEISEDLLSFEPPLDPKKGLASLMPKPVVLKFQASPDEIVAILATAYHTAALNTADMKRVAETLESIRSLLRSETDALELWDILDEQTGRAELKRTAPAIIQVRDWFKQTFVVNQIQRIHRSFELDQEMGWLEWQKVYTEALIFWRVLPLCTKLVEDPLAIPELARSSIDFKHLTQMVVCEQWAETYPMLENLTKRDFLHPIIQARLVITAAQIQLYYFLNHKQAYELLRKALELAPNYFYGYAELGNYWIDQNNLEKAERYFRKAIELAPGEVYGYVGMGDLRERQGKIEEAVEWFRQAIDQDGSDSSGYTRLLRLYGRPELFTSNRDSLTRLAEQALVVSPEDEASICRDIGSAFQQAGKYDEAYKWYQKAIDSLPLSLLNYTAMGYAYTEQGNFEAGQHSFEDAIRVAEGAIEGYMGMASLYEKQEKWDEALSWYQQGLPKRQHYEWFVRSKIADIRIKLNQSDQAEVELLHALQIEPDNNLVQGQLLNLAVDQYGKKDLAASQRIYKELIQIAGVKYAPIYHNLIGNKHYDLGEYKEAAAAYKKAIREAPEVAVYCSNLGGAYGLLQDWNAAIKAYQKASELEPDNPEHGRNLGLIFNDEGNAHYSERDYTKAIECYKQALEKLPDDPVIYNNLAGAWKYLKRPGEKLAALDSAISALQKACEFDPKNVEYARDLCVQQERKKFALQFGERTLDLLPVVTPVYMEVARDLMPFIKESRAEYLLKEFVAYTDRLRKRIETAYGIRIPGVLFGENETGLADGAYTIMLSEIPIATGAIALNQRLSTTSWWKLNELGLSGEEATNPLTGEDAFWIKQEDWAKLESAGEELWEIIEFPVRHLEAVLQQNLSSLLGYQEVKNLLEANSSQFLDTVASSSDELTLMTLVLKELLDEQVPIVKFVEIVDEFRKQRAAGMPQWKIRETIRSNPQVRPSLMGNNDAYSHYELGPECEEIIRKSVVQVGKPPTLDMEPEQCWNILTAVGDEVGSERNVALIVDDPDLRPFVRELIAARFPYMPVLTRQELMPELADSIVNVIDLA